MQKNTFKTEKPSKLSYILAQNHIPFPMPCGGSGKCGKCKIHVKGDVSPPCDQEKILLSKDELKNGIRLACLTTVYTQAEVQIGDFQLEGLTYFSAPLQFSSEKSGRGIAIDIGTTTIAAAVIDFEKKAICHTMSTANPQAPWGADVVQRIRAAATGNADTLKNIIWNTVKDILKKYSPLSCAVITANTAMLHILTGKSVDGLLAHPFTPASHFGYSEYIEGLSVYYPPCPSAFIGADILCGTFLQDCGTSLLADIGTNGELSLYNKGIFYFSSVAAGPAFEGTEIECGMPAAPGAISSVYLEDYKIRCNTIDNAPPTGICGSGLIDTLCLYLQLGIIDSTGCIRPYGHRYPQLIIKKGRQQAVRIANTEIYLTQDDIRKLQLAKAAFGAGIETLLKYCGLKKADKLYIAGGFGNYINIKHAIGIGLIPEGVFSQIIPLGNAALFGAAQLLADESNRIKCETRAENAKIIELSMEDTFHEAYMQHIDF